ncbi:hypothetical protein Godav_020843 [Gossypium davidsonii]|uniref:Uncharacterized protein n=2 Tax=Gossypium TaxID=3633 RepID=A0A0D2QGA0_GOSRA|nr:uncharacterized protein LOC105788006 [Gossypium raimondii]KJB18559.1 hypothetical protein B456_003G060100 [Gossypium raimondii]MBA0582051.1 hypothetical protein [Gossypium raimondii]MBA0608651.1 hypothetical protein [Gossypium davidsonii]
MASRFQQFQTKTIQVSRLVTKNGGPYYKELKERAIQVSQLVTKNGGPYCRELMERAIQVSQSVTKNGGSYYRELMERNKTYIKEPSSVETCQLLAKQLFYTRLASIPRRYEAFWKELDSLKELLKTKEAWNIENASMAALIGVECYAWFFGGEIIGRGFTITGYHV